MYSLLTDHHRDRTRLAVHSHARPRSATTLIVCPLSAMSSPFLLSPTSAFAFAAATISSTVMVTLLSLLLPVVSSELVFLAALWRHGDRFVHSSQLV